MRDPPQPIIVVAATTQERRQLSAKGKFHSPHSMRCEPSASEAVALFWASKRKRHIPTFAPPWE